MKIVGDYVSRALYNATVIPEIIKLIAQQYHISEDQAIHDFYKSETAKALNDPETGLYGQSALYIFSYALRRIDLVFFISLRIHVRSARMLLRDRQLR